MALRGFYGNPNPKRRKCGPTPGPRRRNPKPETLNPKHSTLNPKPETPAFATWVLVLADAEAHGKWQLTDLWRLFGAASFSRPRGRTDLRGRFALNPKS